MAGPIITFHLITIFPHIFDSYINESILKRAQDKDIIKIKIHNLRDFTEDKHKTVDDSPFGGGAGMVMMVEPIFRALQFIKSGEIKSMEPETGKNQESRRKIQEKKTYVNLSDEKKLETQNSEFRIRNSKSQTPHIVLLSPRGQKFTQQKAIGLTKQREIVLICGRYEGVDERVGANLADESISIGDYVLTGGELPALTIIDSITRLLPGVLGNKESLKEESFSTENQIEYPQYTRPADFKGWKVPDVVLSGNHQEIKKWRKEHQH
jgi:tRNA (guanine37-N1)-methyltransferase